MNTITSSQNHLIRQVKCLKQRKYREKCGLFFIEGIRFVGEAIKSKSKIQNIFVTDRFLEEKNKNNFYLLEKIKQYGYPIYVISEDLFKQISDTTNPQGILAVVEMSNTDLKEIVGGKNLFMILECVQDPGNMGTIIRTAHAAGFTGLIATKGCVDVYNPKVLRSTMGSIFYIPVIFNANIRETILFLKSCGIKIFAADLNGSDSIYHVDMKSNSAIVVGNEANGISTEALAYADLLVKIPMPGKAESLNASIAAGIMMYESVRQNMK